MDHNSDSGGSSVLDYAVVPSTGRTIDEVMSPYQDHRVDETEDVFTYIADPDSRQGGLVVPVHVTVQNIRDMLDSTVTVSQDLEDKMRAVGWPTLTEEADQTVDTAKLTDDKPEVQEPVAHLPPRSASRNDSYPSSSRQYSGDSRSGDRSPSYHDYNAPGPSAHYHAPLAATTSPRRSPRSDEMDYQPQSVAPRDVFPAYQPTGYMSGNSSEAESQSTARPGPSRKTLYVGHRRHTREVRPRGRAASKHNNENFAFKCGYTDPVTGDECTTGRCRKVYDLMRHFISIHVKEEIQHVESGRLLHHPDDPDWPRLDDHRVACLLGTVVNFSCNRAVDKDYEYLRRIGAWQKPDTAGSARSGLKGLAAYNRCWAKLSGGTFCGASFKRSDSLKKHLKEQHGIQTEEENDKLRPPEEPEVDYKKLRLIYGKSAALIYPEISDSASSVHVQLPDVEVEGGTQSSDLQCVTAPSPATSSRHLCTPTPTQSSLPVTPEPSSSHGLYSDTSSPALRTPGGYTSHGVYLTPDQPSIVLPRHRGSPQRSPKFKLPTSPASRTLPSVHVEHSTVWNARSPRNSLLFLPPTSSPLRHSAELSPALSSPGSLPSTLAYDPSCSSYDTSPAFAASPLKALSQSPYLTDSLPLSSLGLECMDSLQPHQQQLASPWELLRSRANQETAQSLHALTQQQFASPQTIPRNIQFMTPDNRAYPLPSSLELSPDVRIGDLHDIPMPGVMPSPSGHSPYVPSSDPADVYTIPSVAHPDAGPMSGAVYRQAVRLHDALLDPSSDEYARLSEPRFTSNVHVKQEDQEHYSGFWEHNASTGLDEQGEGFEHIMRF
ncbi:hypothetical protein EXIGLDRAFT_431533 [Exidia glandulosa HHB12029]|uniref:Uncharacterized protein n=1 Tax=Exidia glandulosa HHB12029 TaxID=1314781 RepID=A0A165KGS9_EXIGL|nr:hypothetical protein EXIGLDRAFT_431533 [Exidia glandulosa HHB12029]